MIEPVLAPTEAPAGRAVVGRTLALALGAFTLLNSAGELVRDGFDANLWWLDPPWTNAWLRAAFFAATGVALTSLAFRPPRRRASYLAAQLFVALLAALALTNAVSYYRLLGRGEILSGFPVPFSLFLALGLLVVMVSLRPAERPRWRWRDRTVAALLLLALGVLFPLAQMACFGRTDYRRPADCAVVFGAGVWADGTPSLALTDRTNTAIALYHEGLVGTLVFSGGPGRGAVHETEAMTTMAVSRGVPAGAILVDRQGVDTWSTVQNVTRMIDDAGLSRVVAVSHFYHLPRIKMAFHRAGREAYTVPARETRRLRRMPYYMLREVVAFWIYYLRPLTGD